MIVLKFILVALFLFLLIILFLLNFYRDPKRKIPKGNNITSPADGKVIGINIANQCYVISIFMSPLDVHINRAPISGIIKSIKYTKGKFFKAYDLEKSFENEKNEIVIQDRLMKVKVVQIAGFLARRIKCYVKKNQKVNKGEKIGMIALGSQTTLVIPRGVELKVKVNDKVKAGETIIGETYE